MTLQMLMGRMLLKYIVLGEFVPVFMCNSRWAAIAGYSES